MKTHLFLSLIALTQMAISQNKKNTMGYGVQGGLMVGESNNNYSANIGTEAVYLRQISNRFYMGANVGITHYFGKEVFDTTNNVTLEIDNAVFIPIGLSLRLSPFKNIIAGPDIDYAFDVGNGSGGGFYLSPRISYLINGKIPIAIGYRSISVDGTNLGSLQFGFGYSF